MSGCELIERSGTATVERGIAITATGRPSPIRSLKLANLTGDQALFLLKRG